MKPLLQQHTDILKRKLDVDGRISSIRLELDKASAEYNTTGRGMSRERYFKLRTELAGLKHTSQRLQMELAQIKRQIKNGEIKTLGEHFIDVAKLELNTEQFHRLLHLAISLRNGEIS